jgi:cysteine desulfuration protein SufE
MSDSIADREAEIVDQFSMLDDWMERYEHLIELGESLPRLEEEAKPAAWLVKGCQSQVWLRPEFHEGRMFFRADSDALITKGLVALLVRVLEGQPAAEIAHAELRFIDQIGLREHLSPTRKNGLAAMVANSTAYALAGSIADSEA